MFRFLVIVLVCLSAGCSAYDVTALTADAVVMALVGPSDDEIKNRQHDDDETIFWDPNVSTCIRSEKKARNLDQQLNNMFDAVERGREYVVLPNGERYTVGHGTAVDLETRTPTAECIDRHSD